MIVLNVQEENNFRTPIYCPVQCLRMTSSFKRLSIGLETETEEVAAHYQL
jgi:hypothetical protein